MHIRTCVLDSLLFAGAAALVAGCGVSTGDGGNPALGIARFDTVTTGNEIVVTGYSDSDAVVGQIDLVHGSFDVLDELEAKTDEVANGRLLKMTFGDQRGFVQLLDRLADAGAYHATQMLPFRDPKAAGFVLDPHVKTVLDDYGIRFNVKPTAAANGEVAYEYYQYDFQSVNGGDLCWYNSSYTNSNGVVVGSGPSCFNPSSGQQYGYDAGAPNNVCSGHDLVKQGWYANYGAGATGVSWGWETGAYGGTYADLNQCCYDSGTGNYFESHKSCSPSSPSCTVVSNNPSIGVTDCNINYTVLQQWDEWNNQESYTGHQW